MKTCAGAAATWSGTVLGALVGVELGALAGAVAETGGVVPPPEPHAPEEEINDNIRSGAERFHRESPVSLEGQSIA